MKSKKIRIRTFLYTGLALVLIAFIALFLMQRFAPNWWPFEKEEDVAETLIPDEGAVKHVRSPYLTHLTLQIIGATEQAAPYSLRWRMGVGIPDGDPMWFKWPKLRPGWYLNWTTMISVQTRFFGLWRTVKMNLPDNGLGMEFVPMVRTPRGRLSPRASDLAKLAKQYPGRTWLIGNEPDVRWQDNAKAEDYAVAYHNAYTAIKGADPTAQVAIGGISQVTPIRLQYLDQIWSTYQTKYGQTMPVDIWNIHAFVLREKLHDWGVGMPPGFTTQTEGVLWDVADHNNLKLVEGQVRQIRQWMAAHGQQQKPLWITEYGILMPESYGFPPQVVRDFMLGSFDLFGRLRDPQLGYAADDNRLVQRWVWFSTRYDPYPTGNLFNISGQPKPLMSVYGKYITDHDQ